MIVAKLSGVTGTAAPVKISWQVCGTVSPIVVEVLRVHPTAVLIAAVALELACAKLMTDNDTSTKLRKIDFRIQISLIAAVVVSVGGRSNTANRES
jgi:hypothetical protein